MAEVGVSVDWCAYGADASARLHDAVTRAKHGDALAPVTVVVPTNSVGVAARRRLASGSRGIAGVTFLTVFRLAELLGAPRLAAQRRRPVSTPVIAAAIRRVLARDAGMFAPVAAHPATEEALVALHRELADLDDAQLDVLRAQSRRASEVVRIHRAAQALLRPSWHDEHDLMDAAMTSIEADSPLLRDVGRVVCFLPQRWAAPAARLLDSLASHTTVHVVAGLTGSTRADAAVVTSVARLGVKPSPDAVARPATGTAVRSTSDADDEVRAIVRDVVDAMGAGVPLERMAVLYGPDVPYARLIHEQLAAAGIAHNGVALRSLAESVVGRTLLELLALADNDFRRDDVCAWFARAPLLDGHGRFVPATAWERVSRRAGVVGGIGEWNDRLLAHAAVLGDSDRDTREREHALELRSFMGELTERFARDAEPRSWRAWSRFAHGLLRAYLGGERRRESWPLLEQDAARRVELALDRLAGLDAIDAPPDRAVFRRTLELELAVAHEKVGRLGEGLLAAPAGLALGLEFDRVWVCGLAEGVFPAAVHDDPLLHDGERAALDGALRSRAERVDDAERAVLTALASTNGARVCSWPRGDLRRSTEHVPSRFLHATIEACGLDASDDVASYAQGVVRSASPATEHELGVRGALADASWVRSLDAVERGTELLAARASRAFTRFDGNLSQLALELRAVSPLDASRPVSATRLEAWADCPHAYFMQHVLRVERVERPEEIMQISPLERGSLVHAVLDRFLAEGPRDRARLQHLAATLCDEVRARGLTGKRLLWERDRRLLLAELDAFFDADEQWRSECGATTLATELKFGFDDTEHAAVPIEFDDGRALSMRGMADRVDRRADGSLVVIDYKTGSETPYVALGPDDPVLGGTRLQLPVYARAARQVFGEGDQPVDAYYWFVGRGNNRRIGYPVDADIDAQFLGVVRTIVDGIERGVFVAHPPPPGPRPFVLCPFCDPDALGTATRWREWERKADAPELAEYRSLLEGPS